MNASLSSFAARVLSALALATLAFFLWRVIDVVVLASGGILVAIFLRIGGRKNKRPLCAGPAVVCRQRPVVRNN
jgi:hypothetical protein